MRIGRREPTTAGIQVVVGDDFEDLVAGEKSVKASDDVSVCGPAAPTA